jgi:hypothetical protein
MFVAIVKKVQPANSYNCTQLTPKTASVVPGLLDCRRTAVIQQRVTAVLRSIPNEAFADSFQKLYERCQPCVVKDDNYFEGQ